MRAILAQITMRYKIEGSDSILTAGRDRVDFDQQHDGAVQV